MSFARRLSRPPDLYAAAMDRRRPVSGLLLGAAVIALGACSGGSSSAGVTAPESVVETTEAPVATAAETTVPETTPQTTPASTEAPEPAPETTEAPPETSPELTLEEQINRDLALGEEALAIAAAGPADAAARDGVAQFFGGENLEALLSLYDQLVEQGWVAQPNPDTPSFTVLVGDVVANEAQDEVIAVVCRVDSVIVVDPGDSDDPNDLFIINADITRYVFEIRLQFDGSHWKHVENLNDISETPGATTCDV